MSNNRKEFWVSIYKDKQQILGVYNFDAKPGIHIDPETDEVIHVIEYDEAKEKAIEGMVEAFKWVMPKVHQGNHIDDPFECCPKATCVEYRKALAAYRKVTE